MLDFKINVPFFDTSAQYLSAKADIDEVLQLVLEKGTYINGAEVEIFANNLSAYLNIDNVIPCANGTDALTLALMALGLERGDEIIVPTFNFIAAAEAVSFLGLTPVFADINPDDFNINIKSLEDKITTKTKAIIVVHLFGAAAYMDAVVTLASKHKIYVIEDVAQALGSEYKVKKLGTLGDIGCTSFFPTKNLACFGDGGAVFTNNQSLGNKIKMLANHGQQKKYEHQYIGVNSRLDTIQSAILNLQLNKLDENIEKRRVLAVRYTEGLNDLSVSLPLEKLGTKHSYNQFCIKLGNDEQRDSVKQYLHNQGISTMIYYSKPNHLQEAFAPLKYKKGDFPIAEDICDRVLALPVYPNLTFEQQDYIIENIKSFFANA